MSAAPDDVASLIEERELTVDLQLSFFRSSCVQRTRLMERRRRTASCIRRMCIMWRYAPYIILPRVAAALPAGSGQSPHRSPPTHRSAPPKAFPSAEGAAGESDCRRQTDEGLVLPIGKNLREAEWHTAIGGVPLCFSNIHFAGGELAPPPYTKGTESRTPSLFIFP